MFSSTRFVPFRLYRFLGPVWISGQYGWWLAALDVNWTIVMVLVSSIWLSLAKERGVVVGARGSCHPNACMHECTAGAPAESEIGRLRQTQLLRAKAFVMMFNWKRDWRIVEVQGLGTRKAPSVLVECASIS